MKLKKINLNKCDEHNHPDIRVGRYYLAKIGGELFAGKFSREWYGLNFDGWYGVGLQLDAPGTNASSWEGLWAIIR